MTQEITGKKSEQIIEPKKKPTIDPKGLVAMRGPAASPNMRNSKDIAKNRKSEMKTQSINPGKVRATRVPPLVVSATDDDKYW